MTRTSRSVLLLVVGLLAVVGVMTVVLVRQGAGESSAPASSSSSGSGSDAARLNTFRVERPGAPVQAGGAGEAGQAGGAREADGAVPDGVTVFDGDVPAVAKLDPELLQALRRAATEAAHDGVGFGVNSGWRSPAYQNRLLREAVAEYGSEEEAARWVATARTSPHVSGDAVDIGPSDATAWLSEHGAAYGLCQIYRNEPWHYELRPAATGHGCPPMYADPTQDPRMQQ
ncbi:M15 family metallopeptidase [Streptomyces sp. SID13726]|uniref:M15 family metallopeptidase n=1 Tax=Streptomyces sp. SID13726 TaxID=2706058 RepID=UPI00194334FE|nr:M15 family metallopeptidase [Streptomyces sp. SID13726]